jgi:hypothetical protein
MTAKPAKFFQIFRARCLETQERRPPDRGPEKRSRRRGINRRFDGSAISKEEANERTNPANQPAPSRTATITF